MDCFCLSARGICRWSWQMLKLVLLFNASCSSAGGHCPSCLVLTERAESLGRGAGDLTFMPGIKTPLGGQEKAFWPSLNCCAEMVTELQVASESVEKIVGTGLIALLNFHLQDGSISCFRPQSFSLSCFVRHFWEAPASRFWWWIDLEDPLLIVQLQKLLFIFFSFPSKEEKLLQGRGEK
jgi:hypothetical protein